MKWTVSAAAREWGVSIPTVQKRLNSLGLDVKRGAKFHTKEITRALVGDLKAEKTRETATRADLLELERREKEGELAPMDEVRRVLSEALLPIRQRFDALPSEAAARCNPSDPTHAREALQQWVDDALPLLRKGLPK